MGELSSASTSSSSTRSTQTLLVTWSPTGTWRDTWCLALWRDDSWLLRFTWCFNFSPACVSWRPWYLNGFSESAQRTTWPSNGRSEKCLRRQVVPTFNLGVSFLVEVSCQFDNPCGQGVLVQLDRTSGNSGLRMWTSQDLERRNRETDGPGSSYDDMDATGSMASGTDGADGSGGFDGTAYGVAATHSSSATTGSRSHGNSLPHVPLLAASSPSLPLVLPTRADLETVKRMMKGDTYIGRGCRQRGLTRSVFGNPYKLCDYGRSQAVAKYRQLLDDSPELSSQLINLSGCRLLCHCKRFQQCHADAIIARFAELYPSAYDRDRAAESANFRGAELDGNIEGGAFQR